MTALVYLNKFHFGHFQLSQDVMMMMMFIGTETLVTQLVYESSGMHADRTDLGN